ncbi:hypothetical protein CONCODRAFT_86801 [Conidiobolus coronatus NRRL 28638]|uniref:MIR domain-containing protein n=1 Tax=Conidiobolus coronatus (strain ATCC 28846 / CBS 209.66 / NRRL 28638) TaxID=796925 RepID=A0A137NY80_CONC2|nr:hypothetical protein CONCODRAFT_86801 [Conidiobolus coronatus NRRL 28638]|eukprot:KXN67736.1 hypothetical protein CONCODRAFT_86801 [Conidiobolus coronatus NRRL 28638]
MTRNLIILSLIQYTIAFNFFNFGGNSNSGGEEPELDKSAPKTRKTIENPKPYSGFERVTYNSMIKLTNLENYFKLNSQSANYGSGSGQQVVTAQPSQSSGEGFWIVEVGHNQSDKELGEAVKCGDYIQLRHSKTGNYLHSHQHSSPISDQQEVSAFDGVDSGNNWKVHCHPAGEKKETVKEWLREEPIGLVHVDTNKHLTCNEKYKYNHPISGHIEVSAASKSSSDELKWLAQEGIYFSQD